MSTGADAGIGRLRPCIAEVLRLPPHIKQRLIEGYRPPAVVNYFPAHCCYSLLIHTSKQSARLNSFRLFISGAT